MHYFEADFSDAFPHEVPAPLRDCLKGLGHFVYLPNHGNQGDGLIAVATLQLFDRMGLSYEIYDRGKDYSSGHTLVYGGGGAMVPQCGSMEGFRRLFTAPGLERCVILPHSMRGCPSLLEVMDGRFTIFLREQDSFDYVRAHNSLAQVLLADDMVFYLNPRQLPDYSYLRRFIPAPGLVDYLGYIRERVLKTDIHRSRVHQYLRFWYKTHRLNEKELPRCMELLADGRRLAWFLRTDDEKSCELQPGVAGFDVSIRGGSRQLLPEYNILNASYFLHSINRGDVIVTDRLHVAIAAALLNKQVMMLDNVYGKLSAVWKQSMQHMPHVHFYPTADALSAAVGALKQG